MVWGNAKDMMKAFIRGYVQSFYLRPDGEDREYSEYRQIEEDHFYKVFSLLYEVGFWVRRLLVVYTSAEFCQPTEMPEVTIFLEIRGGKNYYSFYDWTQTGVTGIEFIRELIGELGHEVKVIGCSCNLLVIQESE